METVETLKSSSTVENSADSKILQKRKGIDMKKSV